MTVEDQVFETWLGIHAILSLLFHGGPQVRSRGWDWDSYGVSSILLVHHDLPRLRHSTSGTKYRGPRAELLIQYRVELLRLLHIFCMPTFPVAFVPTFSSIQNFPFLVSLISNPGSEVLRSAGVRVAVLSHTNLFNLARKTDFRVSFALCI